MMDSCPFIEDILPTSLLFRNIPTITHLSEFVGATDYIDQIKPHHLSHHIMKGKDHYNRLYIVVLFKGNVQTYFQRYTNDTSIWTYGEYIDREKTDSVRILTNRSGNIANQPDSVDTIKKVIAELITETGITVCRKL